MASLPFMRTGRTTSRAGRVVSTSIGVVMSAPAWVARRRRTPHRDRPGRTEARSSCKPRRRSVGRVVAELVDGRPVQLEDALGADGHAQPAAFAPVHGDVQRRERRPMGAYPCRAAGRRSPSATSDTTVGGAPWRRECRRARSRGPFGRWQRRAIADRRGAAPPDGADPARDETGRRSVTAEPG